MACFSDLPEPLVLETILAYLGPMDVVLTLGSTNKRYRELSKSDVLWRWFSSKRSHAKIIEGMTAIVCCNDVQQDDRHEEMSIDIDSFWNHDNQPPPGRHHQTQAAANQLQRICTWVQAFHNTCHYETYKHLHTVGYWPGSKHFIGRIFCRQAPDPIWELESLDGCRGAAAAISSSLSLESDNACRCRTTVHCQWPGCGVGYCNSHIGKEAWEEDDLEEVGQKWNQCSVCRLELCRECNASRPGESSWIESQPTTRGMWKVVCVDCRDNLS